MWKSIDICVTVVFSGADEDTLIKERDLKGLVASLEQETCERSKRSL
jgi:hypothetical protein